MTENESCVDVATARFIMFGWLIIPAFLLMTLYHILWGSQDVPNVSQLLFPLSVSFVLGILVHEILHLAGFILAGASPSAIKLTFDSKSLTAAVTCSEYISAKALKITCVLPLIILGIWPAFVGLTTGFLPLTVWSILMITTAAGDIAVLYAIWSVPGGCPARLHGTKIGCRYYWNEV